LNLRTLLEKSMITNRILGHGNRKRKEEEAMHIEDTQRLVTEIEMVKVVL
jgi:hypothetical protein